MAITTPPHGTPVHDDLVRKVKDYKDLSDRATANYLKDWDNAEVLFRAYVDTSAQDDAGDDFYPNARDVTIPITYAVCQTILTYLMSVFTMRSPIFDIWPRSGGGPNALDKAKGLEAALDYQVRQNKSIAVLYMWMQDAMKYGRGIITNTWEMNENIWYRDVEVPTVDSDFGIGSKMIEEEVIETDESNLPVNIDPYLFYFDPRIASFHYDEGEFAGHRVWRHIDYLEEREWTPDNLDGLYDNLAEMKKNAPRFRFTGDNRTAKRKEITKDADYRETETGDYGPRGKKGLERQMYPIDEFEVRLIPKNERLGDSTRREKWVVTLGNNDTIIRAEPSPYPGPNLRYFLLEPYGDAYSVGHPGLPQMTEGMQRTLDWLFNSHFENVRKVLNDMFIYDPSIIHAPDVEQPQPGRLIRLEKKYWGWPNAIEQGIKQFKTQDVTSNNIPDASVYVEMMQRMHAATDVQMGIPAGERTTFGEIQHLMTQSASRLRLIAQLFSVMGIRPWVKAMVRNTQEFMSEEKYFRVAGEDQPRLVNPNDLQGTFDLPITDGVTPVNPAFHLETHKEILIAMMQQPELAKTFDVASYFNYVAKLMGADNLDQFMRQQGGPTMGGGVGNVNVVGNNQIQPQVEAGNIA